MCRKGVRMITGAIRSQIDRIWDAFWSGGISNPLEVIEHISYLSPFTDVTPKGPDGLFSATEVDHMVSILTDVRAAAVTA